MTSFSERAVLAAAKAIHPDAFDADAHPVAAREATATARQVLSAAVLAETMDRIEASQAGRHQATDDAILAAATALAVNRGFTMPTNNLEFCTPRSKIGLALRCEDVSRCGVLQSGHHARQSRARRCIRRGPLLG
jgi:hypothetical protein